MASANTESTENDVSHIQQFFRDNTIFVTGGTGFLGNVLLEKLLRLVPNSKFENRARYFEKVKIKKEAKATCDDRLPVGGSSHSSRSDRKNFFTGTILSIFSRKHSHANSTQEEVSCYFLWSFHRIATGYHSFCFFYLCKKISSTHSSSRKPVIDKRFQGTKLKYDSTHLVALFTANFFDSNAIFYYLLRATPPSSS